jgi:hypothetical protein
MIVQTYSSNSDFNKLGFNTKYVNYSSTENRGDLLDIYKQCDCFIIPYSFTPNDRGLVTTSFPQKIAEIIQYGRNILVFAPEYSSISIFFKGHDLAYQCNTMDLETLKSVIRSISNNAINFDNYTMAYQNTLSADAVVATFKKIIDYLPL